MTAATRVLQRNLLVYRRTFRGSIFSSFVTPLLYLTAMGLGLGQLVTRDVSSLLQRRDNPRHAIQPPDGE